MHLNCLVKTDVCTVKFEGRRWLVWDGEGVLAGRGLKIVALFGWQRKARRFEIKVTVEEGGMSVAGRGERLAFG